VPWWAACGEDEACDRAVSGRAGAGMTPVRCDFSAFGDYPLGAWLATAGGFSRQLFRVQLAVQKTSLFRWV